MTDLSPFAFALAISETKDDLITDEKAEALYKPFVVNKFLSFHMDCVLRVNEVNRRPWLPRRMQHDFLINTIPKRRRLLRYEKGEKDAYLGIVQETYGYGYRQAKDALDLLSIDQLEQLKKELETGGVMG